MKRHALRGTLLAACVLLGMACSQKYVCTGVLDPTFNTGRTYRVAVMPLLVRGLQTPDAFQRDMAYAFLQQRLMETGKFSPSDKASVDAAVRMREFGQQGTVDAGTARAIGKEMGVDLVCLAELSFDQIAPTVMMRADVQILGVETHNVIYSGTARAANPASSEAAAQLALELATKKLVEKMK